MPSASYVLLEELMKGRTAFVIAHRLSTVRRADVILVLQDGRIAEHGSFGELMSRDDLFLTLPAPAAQDSPA